ncbi:hypothetical protein TNCV_1844521 [Trichonephila clavipes]|nr:hypothetical protein TNCV_1844521 [Trichonephila clavipes]
MCICPPSNKVATIPKDTIANAVFCCNHSRSASLSLQVQSLSGVIGQSGIIQQSYGNFYNPILDPGSPS